MKRTLRICALLLLAATTAACGFNIFEDIGSDPHPPAFAIIGLVHYVPPPEPVTPASAASSPQGRAVSWDSGGFTISTGQQFSITRSYADTGGDIVKFHLRDRDGALSLDLSPTEKTYFSGTSGTLPEMIVDPVTGESTVPASELIDLTGIYGPHRLELWAEDSHLSRSEKVEFIITLVP
jgi:predicted small secreted protein